jgi:hypothetical protein
VGRKTRRQKEKDKERGTLRVSKEQTSVLVTLSKSVTLPFSITDLHITHNN